MSDRLHTVRSQDGTTIGYEEFGAGPPLVLVHGGVSDRAYWTSVVPALAEHFTVVIVDRRGRGASGDTLPYAIEREFEDVAAVVDAVGEPAHLIGHSYGGVCALEAALRTSNLRTLTLYEPAFGFEGVVPEGLVAELEAFVADGDPDAAVASFMGGFVGLSVDVLAELRTIEGEWQPMVDCVHTLPRELRSVDRWVFDAARYRGIDVPVILLRGTESPAQFHFGVDLVSDAVEDARTVTMPGVDHEAVTTGPGVLVAVLIETLRAEVRS